MTIDMTTELAPVLWTTVSLLATSTIAILAPVMRRKLTSLRSHLKSATPGMNLETKNACPA